MLIPILEAGARTGTSTDDPRCSDGIGEPGDPMFTLQSGHQHAVAFSSKDSGADAQEDMAPTLRAMGHDQSHANAGGQLAVALAPWLPQGYRVQNPEGVAAQVNCNPAGTRINPVLAYNLRGREGGANLEPTDLASLCSASGGSSRTYCGVRRLTPTECERLQGFPDNWTAIRYRGKPAADGPRYRALGNSMAVPVLRWIGLRL
jgi:DNA (cytosine-5)-methyltransferase 1